MSPRSAQFVEDIYEGVYCTAVDGVLRLLTQPPGRRPQRDLVALSDWFLSLDEVAQDRVRGLIRLAVDQSVFGMLAVFDGSRAVSNHDTVQVVVGGEDVTDTHDLHELFRARVDRARGRE